MSEARAVVWSRGGCTVAVKVQGAGIYVSTDGFSTDGFSVEHGEFCHTPRQARREVKRRIRRLEKLLAARERARAAVAELAAQGEVERLLA